MAENHKEAALIALMDAQRAIGNITKNAKANYGKFVNLAKITEEIFPKLHEVGLTITQAVDSNDDGKDVLVTRLWYKDGTLIEESRYPLVTKDPNDPQKFGGSVTYARRYSIMALLGIAAEDDDGAYAATPPKPRENKTAKSQVLAKLRQMGVSTPEKFQEKAKAAGFTITSSQELTEDMAKTWLEDLTSATPF